MSQTMKAVRRVHLYAGLSLCPFVLLFGVTAFLFNHPTAFRDEVLHHGTELTAGTSYDPGCAEQLARTVFERLRVQGFGGDSAARFEWLEGGAEFDRTARLQVDDGEIVHSLRLQADGGAFEVRRASESAAESPPEASDRRVSIELDRDLRGEFERDAARVVARAGLAGASVEVERLPSVRFGLLVDGVRHDAEFDVDRGVVRLRPSSEAEAPGWRRLLTRMHTSHGYPEKLDTRFVWAVLVDVVAFAMVAFGLSGFAMWWQMKKLRRKGAVYVALGLLLFAGLTVAMRAAFTG